MTDSTQVSSGAQDGSNGGAGTIGPRKEGATGADTTGTHAPASGAGDRIVVGVDGSEPSLRALRWAGRQATLTGSSLEAVIAWELPSAYGWAGMLPGLPEDFDLEASAAQVLGRAVEDALPQDQAAAVTRETVMGNPAQSILDRGDGADLIVVGVRGHGTFRSTLLGSVSHTVTLHASCPVVVVRGAPQAASA